ncbi:MAG: NAD-dependent epimerase/dehydratase family protein [Planctomycetota bacterium]|nr:NAD-dependent epimerase/dehydratase family protein [Planctomycetota bacterium]
MNQVPDINQVLVTGGAGYVGAVLVPKLLAAGYRVKVLDLFLFGEQVLDDVREHENLELIRGDIRNRELLEQSFPGCDAIIHLACISNDPSFDLAPELGKSINYDAFFDIVDVAKRVGVRRFIYASSSSVYGVKADPNVTEDLPLEPLTDYSKYKALCEDVLLENRVPGFTTLILRPATVCGDSPRLRLDLTVNILTNHAYHNRVIKVFGGQQMRPNLHIQDMTDLYIQSLQWPAEAIDGKIFNAGYENHKVAEIAEIVRQVIGDDVQIVTTPTDDHRSYHICSDKIRRELGFEPRYTIENAVEDLLSAFQAGRVPNAMDDERYYNVKLMKNHELK